MLAFLQRLAGLAPNRIRVRPSLTPGRLYAKMSAEFRACREGRACNCTMPLPYTRERSEPGDCNWRLQPLWSECAHCQALVRALGAKYSTRYDVRDPFWVGRDPIFEAESEDPPYRYG